MYTVVRFVNQGIVFYNLVTLSYTVVLVVRFVRTLTLHSLHRPNNASAPSSQGESHTFVSDGL